MNLPGIDWQNVSVKSFAQECKLNQSFLALLHLLDFAQLIKEPTHIHVNILNLLCTNRSEKIHNVEVIYPGLSDHSIIQATLSINLQTSTRATRMVRVYHKADADKFSEIMWKLKHDLSAMDDVEKMWYRFPQGFKTSINECANCYSEVETRFWTDLVWQALP